MPNGIKKDLYIFYYLLIAYNDKLILKTYLYYLVLHKKVSTFGSIDFDTVDELIDRYL